eukprot:2798548-Rhodomonas_salina.2
MAGGDFLQLKPCCVQVLFQLVAPFVLYFFMLTFLGQRWIDERALPSLSTVKVLSHPSSILLSLSAFSLLSSDRPASSPRVFHCAMFRRSSMYETARTDGHVSVLVRGCVCAVEIPRNITPREPGA